MTTGSELLLERLRAATADEYEIDRQIGLGGMAAVFLARDIALDRRVAIKVMRPDLIDVEGIQDRFVIEARTSAQLDHPGIVSVYAVRQRAGLLFIVMKYIEGQTLEAVLRDQRALDPGSVASIVGRVAEALHFAHGAGIVHRDVKPSNIIIDTRGRPVVTDFGIARVMAAQSITVAGSMLGTPTYMSPEQCRGWPATAASDQYSLGVTLYEMLAGRVPFTGTLFELLDAHRDASPAPLGQLVPGIDSALEETVMRMLAKDPGARWGSLAEVVDRLTMHGQPHRPAEPLRATLLFSGGGSPVPTPSGVAAVDHPTPASGAAASGAPVASGAPAIEVEPRDGRARRILVGSVAALVLAVAIFVVLWGQSGSKATPTAARSESVRAPAATGEQAVQSALVPPAQVSTLPAEVSPPPNSKSSPKATVPGPPARTPPPRVRGDSARVTDSRPESVAVPCARLLERVSLGEKLSESEQSLLKRSCYK